MDGSVESYDREERDALTHLPNRAIMACSLPIFSRIGYPTRVQSISELWRYADAMHDGRAEEAFRRLGGLTEPEFTRLRDATTKAAKISQDIGHRIVPADAPMMALIAYRLVSLCAPRYCVFEVGPGCGYLGLMLAADNLDYIYTDACQAFYLWQNRLLHGCKHMPWWVWIDHDRADFVVDVITANHLLNEMHEFALRYLIVRAEKMLAADGAFVVESYGDQRIRTDVDTRKMFFDRGWSEHAGGYILLPPGSKFDAAAFDARSQVLDRSARGWNDVVEMWKSLDREPGPDAQFARYCGN